MALFCLCRFRLDCCVLAQDQPVTASEMAHIMQTLAELQADTQATLAQK